MNARETNTPDDIRKILLIATDGAMFRLALDGALYQAWFKEGFIVGWTLVPDLHIQPPPPHAPLYPAIPPPPPPPQII